MAIKFSQFITQTSASSLSHIVGYNGADNIQITPANFFTSFAVGNTGQVSYFDSASSLEGSNEFVWDSNNNRLGIGTSSPAVQLHVAGTGAPDIRVQDLDGTNQFINIGHNNGNTTYVSRNNTSFGTHVFYGANGSATTERMRVTSSGYVGIGTDSPVSKLDVIGGVTAQGTLVATGISQLGSGGSNVYLTSSSAGNVGIGTSSPTFKLDVEADSSSGVVSVKNAANGRDTFRSENAAGTRTLNFGNDGSGHGLLLIRSSSGSVTNYIAGNGDSYFNGGNVGIGTSSPSSKLMIETGSDEGIRIYRSSANANFGAIEFRNSNDTATNSRIGFNSNELRLEATSTQRFVTDGSDALVIDTSQNATFAGDVIIDNSSGDPFLKLMTAAQQYVLRIDQSDAEKFQIRNTTSSVTALSIDRSSNATFAGDVNVLGEDVNFSTNGFADINNTGTGAIRLRPSGTATALTISSSDATFTGNIITSSTSGNKGIKIITATDAEGFLVFGDADDNSMGGIAYNNNTNSLSIDCNNAERISINSAGNVGIGTTSPATKLQVDSGSDFSVALSKRGSTSSALKFTLSDPSITTNTWKIEHDSSENLKIFGYSTDNLLISTNSVERMRVTSSGNVLFGTTGIPNGTSVYGSGFIPGSNDRMFLNLATSSTSTKEHLQFFNPNGKVGTIKTLNSATQFNTSSDYRLKKDLKDFDGLDKVSKIPVYDFKWKVDDSSSYGVMAHELQDILPDAVSGEKDGEEMQGVDYSKIVPLLIKSIQELKAEVEDLKSKI